ncbi:MAG: GMC family oxidoreductase [Myxococcota bacterium]
MIAIDGGDVRRALRLACDVVVVGSGPAGATVARRLAQRGLDVLVLEEGAYIAPRDYPASGVRALALLYREMGTSVALGPSPIPYLQGMAVGGTSVVNGAISWQLPREVFAAWVAADPALGDALPFEHVAAAEALLEARLSIAPTPPDIAGAKNLLMARGAEALGLEHRPIRRNVAGCKGSGLCLQGCPHGAKLSMDRTLLPDAVQAGARIVARVRVERVLTDRRGAYAVSGFARGGGEVEARARVAVVLAASAIQTPVILRRSGLGQGPVGDGLMAHPGVSVTGLFDEAVESWRGATQGHEVTGLRHEGLKLEALGFDLAILGSRLPGAGRELAQHLALAHRHAVWGAALRAEARGSVRPGPAGLASPLVRYAPTAADVRLARRGVRRLGEVLLAAGAREVYPGVAGFDAVVTDPRRMADIDSDGPTDARAYPMTMTHLFGTARMGSDPESSVVRPDFRHHAVPGLYVADSSVFPTNLGVNPQVPIMALAQVCADRIADASR